MGIAVEAGEPLPLARVRRHRDRAVEEPLRLVEADRREARVGAGAPLAGDAVAIGVEATDRPRAAALRREEGLGSRLAVERGAPRRRRGPASGRSQGAQRRDGSGGGGKARPAREGVEPHRGGDATRRRGPRHRPGHPQ